jgi:putative membrane protein
MFALPILSMLQGGAQEAWDAEAHPLLHEVAVYGPWLLAAVSTFFVLRAIARAGRYRAMSVLGSNAQAAVTGAIREAEKRTFGEIVPVVLERSDEHPSAAWCCALFTLLVGSALLERFLPWSIPHELLACQLGMGAVGFLLALLLPDLARHFVAERRATATTEEQAIQEFHRQGLRETRDRTGVLIFVSLFERRVVVLGDVGIHAVVGDEHWQKTRDAILAGIARGALADGIVEGVRACGAQLAEHFPTKPEDVNELPDRLVVRAE